MFVGLPPDRPPWRETLAGPLRRIAAFHVNGGQFANLEGESRATLVPADRDRSKAARLEDLPVWSTVDDAVP
jgi:hypothetical protein